MSETKLDERLDKYESEPTKDTWAVRQDHFSRRYFVETVDDIGTVVVADVQNEQRARFIAAAGTAAQEAREMGYDPQKAVQALPELLRALRDISGNIDTLGRSQMVDLAQRALASAEAGDE